MRNFVFTKMTYLLFLLMSAFSLNAVADAEITSSAYFENGNMKGGVGWSEAWSLSGTTFPSIVSTDSPFGGTYHMKIIDDGVAERTLSSPVFAGTLSFAWKVKSLDVASDLAFVSVFDGESWHNVMEVTGPDNSETWTKANIDLTTYGAVSKIRFGLSKTTGSWDFFFIDNVVVTGVSEILPDSLEVVTSDVNLSVGNSAQVKVNYNALAQSNLIIQLFDTNGNLITKDTVTVDKGLGSVSGSLDVPKDVNPGNDYRLAVAMWSGDWSERLERVVYNDISVNASAPAVGKWQTIHNDFFWNDTKGRNIRTRSGDLLKHGDTFYWYGAWRHDGSGWRKQYCYSSKDLINWEYKGVVLKTPNPANRMDVEYNETTKQFVMTLKHSGILDNQDNAAYVGIATSPNPDGPFTMVSDEAISGLPIGDMSVYKDDDDQVYLAYVWWANDFSVKQGKVCINCTYGIHSMSDDYLKLGERQMLWRPGPNWYDKREAPVIFKRDGTYFYATSVTHGINSSPTAYHTSPSIDGPWTEELTPLPTPGDDQNKTWDCQIDFVYPIKGENGTVYLFGGDRWRQDKRLYRSQGDYLWLPLEFNENNEPVLNFYQDWEINIEAGEWRPFDYSRNLALNKPVAASSQVDGNTANKVTAETTFKNYTSFRWQSESTDSQWIRVDLGSVTELNRVILKWHENHGESFNIQVSEDLSSWTTVYTTTLGAARTVTDVTFDKVNARFVRMLGTKQGNGKGYSLFNFMVLNDKE